MGKPVNVWSALVMSEVLQKTNSQVAAVLAGCPLRKLVRKTRALKPIAADFERRW